MCWSGGLTKNKGEKGPRWVSRAAFKGGITLGRGGQGAWQPPKIGQGRGACRGVAMSEGKVGMPLKGLVPLKGRNASGQVGLPLEGLVF